MTGSDEVDVELDLDPLNPFWALSHINFPKPLNRSFSSSSFPFSSLLDAFDCHTLFASNSGIILEVISSGIPPILLVRYPKLPITTNTLDLRNVRDWHRRRGGIAFEHLKCESTACVPCDMTVHEPASGIVGLESDHQIASEWK